ncbi:glycosyltransferase family 4 protein [Candidatus Halocynthiibacter alkanivorans]|uniref:glycosyltransferase family 4 protein n=1 Tax=Candidatus Halocynthiibacter alkanivorans TaxID=2267619 RepID=UPI000DF48B78|nr:glycosyltransferase family 1 protein [Candidatus Halocynthiibacter alkanivorans]
MTRIYYDLSELFYAMSDKIKYYGIARTIIEVGYELSTLSTNICFVIYSPGHRRFFEVTPRIGHASENGTLDLGLPAAARPKRLRRSSAYSTRSAFHLAGSIFRRRSSLKRWRHIAPALVTPATLTDGILISLSQPRVVSDYIHALKQQKQTLKILPLLHDFIPLHENKKRTFNSNFVKDNAYILEHCGKILANSEFTRDELKRFSERGDLPQAKQIAVAPLAHEFRAETGEDTPLREHQGFLLCVGCTPGRKNLECVLDAMAHLQAQGAPVPDLVLAGGHRKRIDVLIASEKYCHIRDNVRISVDPSQQELMQLYKNAIAVVLPSLIEGWGLPAAEALWLGTPAIVSDIPVMHEVVGDLGLYFDPKDATELAARIRTITEDPNFRNELTTKIRQRRPALRSWQDVARDIIHAADTY